MSIAKKTGDGRYSKKTTGDELITPNIQSLQDLIDANTDEKADKVIGAVANNYALLDANGNIVDSGITNIDLVHRTGVETIGGNKTFFDNITIQGDFTVNGTKTEQNVETLTVDDNIITTNDGETGSGVTAGYAGLEIDRGLLSHYRNVFDEFNDFYAIGEFYYDISYSSLSETFSVGETITGGTSAASGVVVSDNGSTAMTVNLKTPGTPFQAAETITGGTSSATSTVTSFTANNSNLQAVATRENSPTSKGITFWNDTAKRLDTASTFIYDNGKVGIGTTNPLVLLDMAQSAGSPQCAITSYKASGDGRSLLTLRLSRSNTIGTASPTQFNDVVGAIDVRGVTSNNVFGQLMTMVVSQHSVPGTYNAGRLRFGIGSTTKMIDNGFVLQGSADNGDNIEVGINKLPIINVCLALEGVYTSYILDVKQTGTGPVAIFRMNNASTNGIYVSNSSTSSDSIKDLSSNAKLTKVGVWTDAPSYRRYKNKVGDIENVLDKIKNMDIDIWQYKDEKVDDVNRYLADQNKHCSPYIDDFHNIFEIGSGNNVTPMDQVGVLFKAVKALISEVEQLKTVA